MLLLVLGCITRLILVSYYIVAILDPKSIGPFEIKEGKEKLKRYGALVKCLASRAIDTETTKSMVPTYSSLHSGVSLLDVVTLNQFDVITKSILLGQKRSWKKA